MGLQEFNSIINCEELPTSLLSTLLSMSEIELLIESTLSDSYDVVDLIHYEADEHAPRRSPVAQPALKMELPLAAGAAVMAALSDNSPAAHPVTAKQVVVHFIGTDSVYTAESTPQVWPASARCSEEDGSKQP